MAMGQEDQSDLAGEFSIVFTSLNSQLMNVSQTTEDIGANWRSVMDILNRLPILSDIDEKNAEAVRRNSFITWANDFYSHNDMDMVSFNTFACCGLA